MLRLASARTPGSNLLEPVRRAASMSMVPTTRSSDALMGSSTTRMRLLWEGRRPADLSLARQSSQRASLTEGSQPKWQPSTTSCSGRSLARARTAVDLPVPFSPRMRTPPMVGTTALRIRASFIDSWPTIAVKGKLWRSSVMLTWFRLGGGRKKGRGFGWGLGGVWVARGCLRGCCSWDGLGGGCCVGLGWLWGRIAGDRWRILERAVVGGGLGVGRYAWRH